MGKDPLGNRQRRDQIHLADICIQEAGTLRCPGCYKSPTTPARVPTVWFKSHDPASDTDASSTSVCSTRGSSKSACRLTHASSTECETMAENWLTASKFQRVCGLISAAHVDPGWRQVGVSAPDRLPGDAVRKVSHRKRSLDTEDVLFKRCLPYPERHANSFPSCLQRERPITTVATRRYLHTRRWWGCNGRGAGKGRQIYINKFWRSI